MGVKETAVAQWLRCCATNWKVAGLIPDGVSGFFIDKILPIALWLWGRPPVPLSQNLGTLTSWNPLGPSGPVTGLLYLYLQQSQ